VMNLSKTFLISLFILIAFSAFGQETLPLNTETLSGDVSADGNAVVVKDPNRTEYYRSNSNGLTLVEIKDSERMGYKFVLQVDYDDNKESVKILYRHNSEIKRWEYSYKSGILDYESYIKEGVLSEMYYYDRQGHKIREENYKNGQIIKVSTFSYNREGLVSLESTESKISNQVTETRYRYDNLFRIKQIARTYPDGHVVYWESFLSDKGILVKEYYTLENEKYVFYYNKFGQEVSGQILAIEEKEEEVKDDDKENASSDKKDDKSAETDKSEKKMVKTERVKSQWENTYIEKGLRDQKVEENFELNKKVITNYNKDGKETKIQIFFDDVISTIEYYDYDSEKRVIYYKIIQDLNKDETFYRYNEAGDIVSTRYAENGKTKKEVINHPDGIREEIIYTRSNAKISKMYDADGNLIR
jgi:hypothetical protein